MSLRKDSRNIPSSASPQGDKLLTSMLEAMQIRIDEMQGDVHVSQEMLPLGVDTDLIADFKKLISDPVSHILTSRTRSDEAISSLLTFIVKNFVNRNKNVIKNAYKTSTGVGRELHFSIVLAEDNFENRSQALSFLRFYKTIPGWENFPIKFQIVPEELIQNINILEKVA